MPQRKKEAPHPVDVHVGKKLKFMRTLRRLSQTKLAKQVDRTFQQIQKYERGTNRIGASMLYQLAKALDVPVSYFFEEIPEGHIPTEAELKTLADQPQEPFISEVFNTDETIKVVAAYYSIPDKKLRQHFYYLLKTLGKNFNIADYKE